MTDQPVARAEKSECVTILVIVDHDNESISASTLNTVAAAKKIGGEIHLLVAGYDAQRAATAAAAIEGVSRVLLADARQLADGLAENIEATVLSIAPSYSHILVSTSAYGKSIAPRIAAKLDVAQISDIIEIHDVDTFDRPIYAGSVVVTVRSCDPVKVITVRTASFRPAAPNGGNAVISMIEAAPDAGISVLLNRDAAGHAQAELANARIVVSGGRGLGSRENYTRMLIPLAEKLHAVLGASHAAVEAGYSPISGLVGQTGSIVAPTLYVAVGISGAMQHLAGVKDSRVIVAINKDPEAPIFGMADYGLVGDLFTVVPELVSMLP